MDENTTIKALPLYKRLIELAGYADDAASKAGAAIGYTKIKQRGRYEAFTEAAEMVKELSE